jgi:hypothetical protein
MASPDDVDQGSLRRVDAQRRALGWQLIDQAIDTA